MGFMLGSTRAHCDVGGSSALSFRRCQVPKIEFMVRKSYGVAADALTRSAYPTASTYVLGGPLVNGVESRLKGALLPHTEER